MRSFVRALVLVQLVAGLAYAEANRTLSMAELRKIPHLTPRQLASYFSDFEFKFHEEVQIHDVFLKTKSGDCDDYATVVAEILAANGYTPRMIAIRMQGETHVICYIEETHSYLDYNTRKEKDPLVPCSPEITAIATNVAKSFGRDWVATYEFTYSEEERTKRLVNNIVPHRSDLREARVLSSAAAKSGAKKTSSPKQQ